LIIVSSAFRPEPENVAAHRRAQIATAGKAVVRKTQRLRIDT
jgi:hypothetical protein